MPGGSWYADANANAKPIPLPTLVVPTVPLSMAMPLPMPLSKCGAYGAYVCNDPHAYAHGFAYYSPRDSIIALCVNTYANPNARSNADSNANAYSASTLEFIP